MVRLDDSMDGKIGFKLVEIVSNRATSFIDDPKVQIREFMTKS